MSDPSYHAEQYMADEEDANYHKCFSNAEKHGISSRDAMQCDSESLLCPDCPFVKESSGE